MEIIYFKQPIKYLKSLPKNLRERIMQGVSGLPAGDIKKLTGYNSTYRLRVGDYRILFNIDDDTITVTNILPRGEAYKR